VTYPPLPEPYRRAEVSPAGQRQPLPGWPEMELYEPAQPLAPVEARRVVGYERYAGMLVPVYEAPPAPYRPPDPPPYDPWPKRILATGAASPLVGWGGAMLFNALAGAVTALALIVTALILAKLSGGRGQRGGDTYNTHVHQKWFGRARTDNQ